MFDEKTNGIIAGVWVTLGIVAIVLGEGAAAKVIGLMLLLGLGAFLFGIIKSSVEAARRRESESCNPVVSDEKTSSADQVGSEKTKSGWINVPKSNAKVVYHSEPSEPTQSRTVYRSTPSPNATNEVGSSFKGTGATDFFLQHRVPRDPSNPPTPIE